MQENIDAFKKLLNSLADVLEQDIAEEETTYLAHMIVGVLCSSREARNEMASAFEKISGIILNDLNKIYN